MRNLNDLLESLGNLPILAISKPIVYMPVKKLFYSKPLLFLLCIVFLFEGCQKNTNPLSNRLLLEQSKELTQANKREFQSLLVSIQLINLKENLSTSNETRKMEQLFLTLEEFETELQKTNRSQAIVLSQKYYRRLKDEPVFNTKLLKLTPLKYNELEVLSDDVFKSYAASKISKLYLNAVGYVYTTRSYGRSAI